MCARTNTFAQADFPLLCYVTDRHALPATKSGEPVVALRRKIEEIVAAGIDWVQLREKDLSAKDLASLTGQSLRVPAQSSARHDRSARILINDRLDLAIAERAGGVHLGENSIPVAEAKRLMKLRCPNSASAEPFLIGVSCHSLESAQAAEKSGADYIFFGPVFATPSKAIFGPPQGVDRLAEACGSVSIPVLAIGGITLDNAQSCRIAGAAGIAAIRLFQDAIDPAAAIQRLRQLLSFPRRQPPADRN